MESDARSACATGGVLRRALVPMHHMSVEAPSRRFYPTPCGAAGWALVSALVLAACSAEERRTGPDQPQSAPRGADDPRIPGFEGSRQQVSQGSRYFAWYGCAECHGTGATGVLDLGDGKWRQGGAFDQVYRAIAVGHSMQTPSNGATIPAQQLWQITAYARSLARVDSGKRRRQDKDQAGEPQASRWAGPNQ